MVSLPQYQDPCVSRRHGGSGLFPMMLPCPSRLISLAGWQLSPTFYHCNMQCSPPSQVASCDLLRRAVRRAQSRNICLLFTLGLSSLFLASLARFVHH